jgi:hypothetical protein
MPPEPVWRRGGHSRGFGERLRAIKRSREGPRGLAVVGNDDGREDMALARRPQGDGGDGREGDWSGEEEDSEGELLDMTTRAKPTRRRGARAD